MRILLGSCTKHPQRSTVHKILIRVGEMLDINGQIAPDFDPRLRRQIELDTIRHFLYEYLFISTTPYQHATRKLFLQSHHQSCLMVLERALHLCFPPAHDPVQLRSQTTGR
ncbi:hypothetical protein J3458_000085 [Metarhizium acridum]|uniref:uncharacterized protein n=1 Tax=Metarhizium acridum TaxID=92637 RepID=UPI001C6BC9CB|nr:hypothetical protein J3458_000085 [Metarhizium acridum]